VIHTVLVVDDEPETLSTVEDCLTAEGYTVFKAESGERGLELFEKVKPSLVVLDVMLPRMDGFQVCQILREQSDVPIIILSARRDEYDKIAGFRMGADDYITKPFSPRELALRVHAILRRTATCEPVANDEPEVLNYGDLSINYRRRSVRLGNRRVHLTAKEFEVLWLLASHPGLVYSREQLLCRIWSRDCEGDINNVTVLVSRLRNKLESDPSDPKYIETVWGIGYKFRSPK